MNSKPVWKIKKIVLPQHADHAGVMWHGKYFNWLEESRINALSKVGISYFELTKNGLDLPLINTSIQYKSPLFLGEKITIESEFNIDKSPRINIISKFHNKKNEILTIAEVNLVLINKLNFSIIRKRPDFLSEAFSNLMVEIIIRQFNDLLIMYIFQVIDSNQYEMESRYQEKSILTNLFTEHKFLGWLGLFIVFFSIFAIFVFQFLEWESYDNNKS